jgi:hypothetical protein
LFFGRGSFDAVNVERVFKREGKPLTEAVVDDRVGEEIE